MTRRSRANERYSFSACERAALAFTDAMTRDVHVEDTVVAPLRSHLNTRTLVELAATVAAYKMVSRFPEALHLAS